jgi:hypothetical protein
MRSFPAAAFWLMPLLLCIQPVAAFSADPIDIEALFEEGNDLFREANETAQTDRSAAEHLYLKAILRFERIVHEGGIRNGKLFYNIGNTYFRMNDIGRAILNYNRAALYTPHNADLRQNLEFARSRRLDDIPVPQTRKILQTLFFWHYDISTKARSTIFIAGFLLCWTALGASLFIARPLFNRAAWAGGVVAALFLASLSIETISQQRSNLGVIVDPDVTARKGNSDSYEQSFKDPLHAGTEFSILEDRGDWVQVKLMDERRCWLPARSIEPVRISALPEPHGGSFAPPS